MLQIMKTTWEKYRAFRQRKAENAIRDLKEEKGKDMLEKMPAVASMIDKLAKRGVIHKNKAANLKSSLTKAISKKA